MQVVLREVVLPVVEVHEPIRSTEEAELLEQLKAGQHGFDVSSAPLLRLSYGRSEQEQCYYCLIEHHHLIMRNLENTLIVMKNMC